MTKDGVSIAREIELRDPFENMGAQMVRQVAIHTSDVAGDGTTTANVLAASMVGGGGKVTEIKMRIQQIRGQIDEATADYDREELQERLAKLAGGVAVLKVGGATEIAMKEKKDRVEDAMHATRAAVEVGVVAGGGVALVRVQQALRERGISGGNHDQEIKIHIVLRAMEQPLREIVIRPAGSGGLVSVTSGSSPADRVRPSLAVCQFN